MIPLLFAAAALVCSPSAAPVRYEGNLATMGTNFVVVAYGPDRFQLQAGVEEAFEEAQRLNGMLSNYLPDSEWSQVNRSAAARPVKVSDELFNLLDACRNFSELSGGAFDITVGPLMKIWGFYKSSGRFPHKAEIRGALSSVGFRHIELDRTRKTVRFSRDGIELDPGGIGKGYAVDRMIALLKTRGITSALITAGSSTIYGLGTPPGERRGWRVSIRHPKDAAKNVQELFLKDESMSTSGNYERFFRVRNRMYSHIMDPRTGYPSEGTLSVSVVTPKTLDGEAWTKPYYINGRRWAAANKQKGHRVFFCEDRTDVPCGWLQ